MPVARDHIPMLFELMRAAREQADSFVPVLFWLNSEGDLAMALAPQNDDGLPGAVQEAAAVLTDMEGPPLWIGVALDAYGRAAETLPDGSIIPAGSLDQRFTDGDPATVEQLMLFLASPETPAVIPIYRQVYRFTPVDGWEWDDIEEVLDSVLPDDRLPTTLTSIVAP